MRALPSHNGRITMYDSPSFAQGGYADPAGHGSVNTFHAKSNVREPLAVRHCHTEGCAESAYKASCGHEWW